MCTYCRTRVLRELAPHQEVQLLGEIGALLLNDVDLVYLFLSWQVRKHIVYLLCIQHLLDKVVSFGQGLLLFPRRKSIFVELVTILEQSVHFTTLCRLLKSCFDLIKIVLAHLASSVSNRRNLTHESLVIRIDLEDLGHDIDS